MTPVARLVGVVLAGGTSRRLGRDKAGESVGDVRMIDRAVAALSGSCAEVVVVSSRSDTPAGPWTRIPDTREPCGPLGGIEAALQYATRSGFDGAFVLACDLPLVDGTVIQSIAQALGTTEASAPRRDGHPDFEPLCAAYRTSCLPAARALLDSGVRAATALFDEVRGVRVEVPQDVFLNVNTEDDLARAESVLSSRDPERQDDA